jgi:signal transduction histidine kinase
MTSVTTGRRRFARVGRVLPIAFVQIVGTVVASRWVGSFGGAGRFGPGGSGPFHGGAGFTSSAPIDAVTLTPIALVLLIAGCVALPFRWRWPVVTLGVVLATTLGFAFSVSARGPFVAALTMALVNAVIRGHRVQAFVAAAVAFVLLPWADLITGRTHALPWSSMTLTLAWLVATLAISELVRVRILRAAEARRARAVEQQRRADDERVRIARELHDSVAHNMSLINLQSGVALHLGAELPSQTRDALTTIRDASREALTELRAILGVLRSADAADGALRSPDPGLSRLADLVDRARAAGLDITLSLDGDPGTVHGITDRSAFRIVQESITNVMKHAPEHRAAAHVTIGPDTVDLLVEDRPSVGSSAVASDPGMIGAAGNGIIGMRERANAVGGTLAAGPTPDGGWRVTARLPIAANPEGTA